MRKVPSAVGGIGVGGGAGAPPSGAASGAADAKGKQTTLTEIQRLQRNREERRRAMDQAKQERAAEEQRNRENGTPGDVDFQRMIRQWRESQAPPERDHVVSKDLKICICVRKRPVNSKEIARKDHDSVTCLHPLVVVHDCKFKVDGISKYLDNQSFQLDHTFHEENTTEDIYFCAVEPMVNFVLSGGRGTVFAYVRLLNKTNRNSVNNTCGMFQGQTGSGKTFTMVGIQSLLVDDLFREIDARRAEQPISVCILISVCTLFMLDVCRCWSHSLRSTEVVARICSTTDSV
jgi:kinesin family protein 2/24